MVNTRSQTKSFQDTHFSILYHGRIIVSLPGNRGKRCMYKSTGMSSGLAETWFPCLGVSKSNPYIKGENSVGWIVKPKVRFTLPVNIQLASIFGSLLERFDTIDSMVISLKIGGGFWAQDTNLSRMVREYLVNRVEYNIDHSQIIDYILRASKEPVLVNLEEAVRYTN